MLSDVGLQFCINFVLSHFAEGLKNYRNDYQCDTDAKREIQLLVLFEDKHGEDDAIHRLQIVSEINGESWNLLQDDDLQ